MYAIGDKYGVLGLKELAQAKFKGTCDVVWNSDEFAEAARYVYSSTLEGDKELRNIVRDTIARHSKLIHKMAIRDMLEDHPELMYDLLKKATSFS